MKKLVVVAAILLALLLTLIYRQLTLCNGKQYPPKRPDPVTVRESIILGSLLIQ